MNEARLLVVSTTPAAQSALLPVLTAAGYEIVTATPDDAAALIDADIELMLIDTGNAGSSFALARQLRAARPHGVIPAIHFAASFSGWDFTAATPDDAYLTQPAEPAVLLSLLRALLQARQAERLKDEFLSTVSHELRTPLNSILGWADILTRQPRESDFSQGLASIERNARLQAQMISDLLDLSRMVSGKLQIEVSAIEPGFVIDGAIKSVAAAAQARQVTINRRTDAAMPLLLADSERLQQIVASLLSNAVKFSAKGGTVDVELARDGEQARISVIDRGRGIAPEQLPYVLDRFRRGSGKARSSGGGLGMGLSLARHLVELHRGTLSVHSDGIGKGAIFTVLLPTISENRS